MRSDQQRSALARMRMSRAAVGLPEIDSKVRTFEVRLSSELKSEKLGSRAILFGCWHVASVPT